MILSCSIFNIYWWIIMINLSLKTIKNIPYTINSSVNCKYYINMKFFFFFGYRWSYQSADCIGKLSFNLSTQPADSVHVLIHINASCVPVGNIEYILCTWEYAHTYTYAVLVYNTRTVIKFSHPFSF